jgi:hypothetical protein
MSSRALAALAATATEHVYLTESADGHLYVSECVDPPAANSEDYGDAEAAKRLNNMGYGNWRQEPFTYRKVRRLRCDYKLCSRYERLRARGLLTTAEMAKRMGVCTATVHHWGCRGMLQREIYGGHHCLYLPPDPRTFVRPTIGRPCSAGSGRNDRST